MKSLEKQIEFIDKKVLPIYGVKNIKDYQKNICIDEINNTVLMKLNIIMQEFRDIFPVKDFSLHKTNYLIKTFDHAFNFLKKMLDISCVPYEIDKNTGKKMLRLLPENKILIKYIYNMEKTSDIRDILDKTSKYINTGLNKYSGKYTHDDLIQNIKKKYDMDIGIYRYGLVCNDNFYEINLSQYGLRNKYISDITISRIDTETGQIINSCVDDHKYNYFSIAFDCKKFYKIPAKYLDGNIVISGWMILNSCHNDSESIMLGIREVPLDTQKNVLFNISVKYVDFYTSFDKKIKDSYIEQEFPYIENKKVITANGRSFMLDIDIGDDVEKYYVQTFKGIPEGKFEQIGKYNTYIMDIKDTFDNMMKRLVGANSERLQPDIVYAAESYGVSLGPYNYVTRRFISQPSKIAGTIKNNVCHQKCNLNKNDFTCKNCDLVYGITIRTLYELNLNNVKVYIEKANMVHDLELEYDSIVGGEHVYKVKNINKYNMINSVSEISLHIDTQSDTLKNNLESCMIESKCCITNTELHKKLLHDNDSIIFNIAQ